MDIIERIKIYDSFSNLRYKYIFYLILLIIFIKINYTNSSEFEVDSVIDEYKMYEK